MAPPADIPKVPAIGLPPSAPAPAPPVPDSTLGGRAGPVPPPPAADHADIRPLDVAGGLQILIAEVRAALEAALLAAAPAGARSGEPGTPAATHLADAWLPEAVPGAGVGGSATAAPEAARQLLDFLLRSLPAETPDDALLGQRLPVMDLALQSASSRALDIINAWHDIPPATQAAAGLASQLVANAVSDEPLLAAWLRPEWAAILPRLERFRRRRRRLRRGLVDPDYPGSGGRADDERR